MGAVFGEVDRFFASGITTAHNGEFGFAELRCGAIADGAGTDAAAPVGVFAVDVQPVGTGSSGHNHAVGCNGLAVHLDCVGPFGEIEGLSIGFDQSGAPAHGLRLHPVHQLRAKDSVRKAGEIFNVGGGHQLTTRNAAVLIAGDEQRAQIGPCGIESCGVAGRAGTNHHKVFHRCSSAAHRRLTGMNAHRG